MSVRNNHRAGVTLFDLLVAIIILASVLALVMPAVQQARDQSRQATCSRNMKQLGLAMHNYHDVYKTFPAMRLGTMKGEGEQASVLSNRYCMSGLVSMLPFYEHQQYYDQAKMRNFGPVPWRNEPNTWAVQISTLLCPSDEPNAKTATGNASYKFCLGTSFEDNHSVWGPPHNGVFTVMGQPAARRRPYRIRDIRDGTSLTLAMSERRIESHEDVQDIANVAINVAGVKNAKNETVMDAYKACRDLAAENLGKKYNAGQKVRLGHAPGERWADGRPYFSGFTTIVPPNGPSCMGGDAHGGPGIFTASSRHPNLVNVLLCDGSTRAVTDDVQHRTWMGLGTRNLGEDVRAGIDDLDEPPRVSRFWQRFVRQTPTARINNPSDMTPEDEAAELKQLATEKPPEK